MDPAIVASVGAVRSGRFVPPTYLTALSEDLAAVDSVNEFAAELSILAKLSILAHIHTHTHAHVHLNPTLCSSLVASFVYQKWPT